MTNAPNDGQGFHSVAALSPTKVYAVGSVIARWTGTTWATESAAVPGLLSDAAATGTSTVWASAGATTPIWPNCAPWPCEPPTADTRAC